MARRHTKIIVISIIAGILVGVTAVLLINRAYIRTTSNEYCMSCHYHSEADEAWKQSHHFQNASGTITNCAECHLPPADGSGRQLAAKVRMGVKDLVSYKTKKPGDIDWAAKRDPEYARKIVYNESCKACHQTLFPEGLSDDGVTAHLYYEENEAKLDLQCISCHLDAGHHIEGYSHKKMTGVPIGGASDGPVYIHPATLTGFEDYVELIPGTRASISMKAIPGGEFMIGSPSDEAFRSEDEGPQKRIVISPFFMGETEVSWDQYWAFYAETMSEGRIDPIEVMEHNSTEGIDAVSGPTPPFGIPDQGWGMGDRPAITMTHYAAQVFCQWLSMKTGRHYRLPTEAEWEYAARGGSEGAYFFGGEPRKFSARGAFKGIFKPDTTLINSYAVYALNSRGRTAEPSSVKPGPFGLRNMYGNVMEYCSDWYSPDAYSRLSDGQTDPTGPADGTEHVVRGGMYSDDASALRSAARGHTMHEQWLRTDPQMPKSIWWYSDIKGIGFRVVCDVPDNLIIP